jgi:hypothetical protein
MSLVLPSPELRQTFVTCNRQRAFRDCLLSAQVTDLSLEARFSRAYDNKYLLKKQCQQSLPFRKPTVRIPAQKLVQYVLDITD